MTAPEINCKESNVVNAPEILLQRVNASVVYGHFALCLWQLGKVDRIMS